MRHLLIKAFEGAVTQVRAEELQMPLPRWNESLFRFMYSRTVTRLEPEVSQFIECSRVDLVLHRGSERAFLEFKFYTHSVAYDALSGMKLGMKGYPSRKNCQEFKKCVDALRRRPVPPEVLKFVALFYADPVTPTRKTYETCYGDASDVEGKLGIRRLTSIGPFTLTDSHCICSARLYEVVS